MRAVEIRAWAFFWIFICGISISTSFANRADGAFVRLTFIDLNQLQPLVTQRRTKRQAYPQIRPLTSLGLKITICPRTTRKPHPGRDASSLSPIFPFTSTFNNGLDINPGNRVTVDGNLNVPILGWGLWDGAGGIRVGRANTRVGFGALGRPTNTFGITPETIETLATDELFNKARENTPSIPVAVLPGNFVPIRCKPPFCNPFMHNAAFGVDVEPGDDVLFDGGMNFPLPLAPGGVGVRIPVSGGVSVGTDPFLITYGHGLGPVEPPNFKSGSDRTGSGFLPAEKKTKKH